MLQGAAIYLTNFQVNTKHVLYYCSNSSNVRSAVQIHILQLPVKKYCVTHCKHKAMYKEHYDLALHI